MDSKEEMENDGSEEEDEGEDEDDQANEDLEEMMEETSNSDSAQEEREGGGGVGNGPRVSFISNSETRLNDFAVHDKNCAKAKALHAQIQSVKGLPGI